MKICIFLPSKRFIVFISASKKICTTNKEKKLNFSDICMEKHGIHGKIPLVIFPVVIFEKRV